jgi:hypothetical protein
MQATTKAKLSRLLNARLLLMVTLGLPFGSGPLHADSPSGSTADSERCIQSCREQQDPAARAGPAFGLILIEWGHQGTDIDLHVFEPSGAHFYFDGPSAPGSVGRMLKDDTGDGSRSEIWHGLFSLPGEYVIAYDLFKGAPTEVTGVIYTRDGAFALPSTQMSGRCNMVGTIHVGRDGYMSFREGGNRVEQGGAEICRLQ